MSRIVRKMAMYIKSNKKRGDINYFLGILIVAVILLAVLAIANASGAGWATSIATAVKNIIDKAIQAIADATNFN